jgi:Flp pilus assembly protein TadD
MSTNLKPALMCFLILILAACSSKSQDSDHKTSSELRTINDSATKASSANKKNLLNKINPEARALNDSAANLMTSQSDSALVLLDKALKIDSNYVIAYQNKVTIYVQKNNFDAAIKILRKLEITQPTNPELAFYLGFLLERTKHTEEANKYYQKAITLNKAKLDKTNPADSLYQNTQLNYSGNLIYAHRVAEGRKIVEEVLKKDPNNLAAKRLMEKIRSLNSEK